MNSSEFLNKNNLLFLCGAGVSMNSNMPGVQDILMKTCETFLPLDVSKNEMIEISDNIQPEIFYEHLLNIKKDYRCLDLWKSLHSDYHRSPNLAHFFIVKYSYLNNSPIITTNFDLLFELAAEKLSIRYIVILPWEELDFKDKDILYILKIHGSLGHSSKSDDCCQNLFTTMTSITKVNLNLIKYLSCAMKDKHLCIVGYSGRDLDLYPYIKNNSKQKDTKKIYWINNFRENSITEKNAMECNSKMIHENPINLFLSHISTIRKYKDLNYFNENEFIRKEEIFDFLANKMKEYHILTDKEKELLYIMILNTLGNYRKAYDLAKKMECRILPDDVRFKLIFYIHLSKLSHENSKFDSCKKYAKIISKIISKNKDEKFTPYYFMSLFLHAESTRMKVVNPIHFKQRLYNSFGVIHTIFIFTSIILKFKHFNYKNKKIHNEIPIWLHHEYIEHKIRFLSIFQGILVKLKLSRLSLVLKSLNYHWIKIDDESRKYGYAAGIGNVIKYRSRLFTRNENFDNAMNIFSLTTSSTGKEISLRDRALSELEKGNVDSSINLLRKSMILSKESGNFLNVIKSYESLIFIYSKYKKNISYEDIKDFMKYVNAIEGSALKKYYKSICKFVIIKIN